MTVTEKLVKALDDYIDARMDMREPRASFAESIRKDALRKDLVRALRAFRGTTQAQRDEDDAGSSPTPRREVRR